MEELELKEILRMLWDGRRIIIVFTIILIIFAAVYSCILQTPKYQSSTTLVLARVESSEDGSSTASVTQTDVTMNQKLVSTYSEIIRSKNVLGQVIENLEIANLTQAELRKSVTVEAIEDTEVIRIIVSTEEPEYSARIANEIGKVFSEKIVDMYRINNVYTLDQAEANFTPYNINPVKYIVIAFVGGIFISCAFIIIKNLFDTTVKSAEAIEKNLKVPVIAQIAYYDENIVKKGGKM